MCLTLPFFYPFFKERRYFLDIQEVNMRLGKGCYNRVLAMSLAIILALTAVSTDLLGGSMKVQAAEQKLVLFDDAEALAITEKSGYSIEDGSIKGGSGWNWIDLKYGKAQDWSTIANSNGVLKFDVKSGWWNSPTGKVRLYVGDSYVELMDVAFPTQTGQWLEIDVALSRFEGADFTQVKGIGLMTYASEKSNWVDNIRVEWDGDPYPGDVSGGDGNVSGGNVGGEPETPGETTDDLQQGASILQMIFDDSFGDNTLVKGGTNTRIGNTKPKVGTATLEVMHPWDNSEWYAIFPEAIDFSSREIYESAAIEFWVKLHGEISWYNFYLFNQMGEGVTNLGRTSVSINDFIDRKKIGVWQKVQIPLSNFTTNGKYVNENQQLQDWTFDFSRVVGVGTAQLAAKGAPTDPLVEYDDVKITLGNLPDTNFGVKIISQKEFDSKNIQFTRLDLKPYMTTGFADEVADDGQGGWSDQGPTNDLADFTLRGEQYFESVPFNIVEPADNNGKSAIALKADGTGVYTKEVVIPIGQKAAGFYVIHVYSYDDNTVATYTYEYTDGTTADITIMKNQQIFNWWGTKESNVVRTIWTGETPDASQYNMKISLSMFPCVNPNPDKEIRNIRLKAESNTCAAMIVAMTLADQGLYLPEVSNIYNPDTSDWYAYEQPDYEKLVGTALDVSYVLDAPAGKHGYVTVKGEDFTFEDGTVAQFWGTNNAEIATFQTHEQIDKYVDVLVASGKNMIRLMDIDGGYFHPNVFGFNRDSITVDADAMDQLCYFWAKCKEKGIYIQYCLLGVRYPSTEMNHPAYEDLSIGFKTEIYFDPKLQEMTRELEKTILTWQNPYTGTTLANDPCVAMYEINNESNLMNTFGSYSGDNYEIKSEYEKNLFRSLFNEYLKNIYGTNDRLVQAWTAEGKTVLRNGENLDNGTVTLDEQYQKSGFSEQRVNDSFAFLYQLQSKYHTEMIQWLKTEIGVKAPVTGTTNLPTNDRVDIYENAQYDYLARHQYQSHPQSGTEYKVGAYTGNVDSVILNPAATALAEDAARRVTGMPYIVNEFQECEPNMYISEFNLVSAAVFSYQGWSGLNFPFHVGELKDTEKNQVHDFFQVMGHPLRFGTMASASLLYHRNEIEEAQNGYFATYSADDALKASDQGTKLPDYAYIVGRAGINMPDATGTTRESDPSVLAKTQEQTLVNEGREILWTPDKGQFLINTTQTQAAAGTITGEKISLDDVDIYTDNYFANITVSALGMDNTIADADQILITAAARARNTGAKLSKDGKKIEVVGEAPILVEQVEGTVTIKNTGDYEVYLLNSSGERVKTATQHKDDQGYTVVEMKLGDHTMHYELIKVHNSTKPFTPGSTPKKSTTGDSTSNNTFSDNGDTPVVTPSPAPSVTGTPAGRRQGTTAGTYNSGKTNGKTGETDTTVTTQPTIEQPVTEETVGSMEETMEVGPEQADIGAEADTAENTVQKDVEGGTAVVVILLIIVLAAAAAAGIVFYRKRDDKED